MRKNEKEREHHLDALLGFAHKKFYDKNGTLLPKDDEIQLHVLTTTGVKSCMECGKTFPNPFRMAEHCISTGHEEIIRKIAEKTMRDFQELERKYF